MLNDHSINNTLPVPGLYGLVVCGGNSSRMGSDKSLLVYHEIPQRYHVYEMLKPFCEKVLISCNANQESDIKQGYDFIIDESTYCQIGPMAALLTFLSKFPGKDFLLIGCDYPFLTREDIDSFLPYCSEEKTAAFYQDKHDLFEPLIAYYHHLDLKKLPGIHLEGQNSLQYFLKYVAAKKICSNNKKATLSVNTKSEYLKTKHIILAENEKQPG